uniref:Uncharacterized protein n=1 Tax=Utricularia reniformis TaxID=192314 RepID=A0A1Y0B114_9LAMI|nr:hypothetical protein AEK19_MT0932 [Utricularia reniformis]ART31156.1 hypothetical protein AEK19_MT0932 [Utricularia reniformis]
MEGFSVNFLAVAGAMLIALFLSRFGFLYGNFWSFRGSGILAAPADPVTASCHGQLFKEKSEFERAKITTRASSVIGLLVFSLAL